MSDTPTPDNPFGLAPCEDLKIPLLDTLLTKDDCVIGCVPVSVPNGLPPFVPEEGSIEGHCWLCGCKVWVGRLSQRHIATFPQTKTICMICILTKSRDPDAIVNSIETLSKRYGEESSSIRLDPPPCPDPPSASSTAPPSPTAAPPPPPSPTPSGLPAWAVPASPRPPTPRPTA